eukprot:GFUD01027327.1.p1 GENE.GFUD01027327.1~~GFUD01027327.1.p1  ORF type:complete len:2646 (+),score=708.19 GFUD01027327.1:241-8178(+)
MVKTNKTLKEEIIVTENFSENQGAKGLRKILNKQPEHLKEEDKTTSPGGPDKPTVHTPSYVQEADVVEKDTEKDKKSDIEISHSNKEGVTEIEIENTGVTGKDQIEEIDVIRQSNEEDICLDNLKNMTDLIKRKLAGKSNQRNSDAGSKYTFSTITETKTFQSTEEIRETISGDIFKTRSAIKKKQVIIIQQTIITIVESVSNWLDKVEYRISTVRKIKTINQKKQELKSIKEEIEVIEETVDELVEVTEMAVEIIDDESKITVTSCVSCLRDQVKVVKLYHQQSEDELSDSEEKWEEYIEGMNTIERLIKDLRRDVDELENTDSISEEKVDTLEQLQIMNKGHMNKVVYLVATGHGLTASLPENQMPDQIYSMYEKAKKIDNTIQKEKDIAVNLILSKDEYENTLAEYDEVVNVAEHFIRSNLVVLDLSHFNEEINRQKKFFINLSHCMQVLDSLEENFSPQIKQHYAAVHDNLHSKSNTILAKSASHINNLDETFSSWSILSNEVSILQSELELLKHRTSNLDYCRIENYLHHIESLQRYEIQLETIKIKTIICQGKSENIQKTVSSPTFNNLFSELNYEIPKMLDSVQGDINKYTIFRSLWKEYEHIQTTIQPWLAMVEEQLENDGRVDLIYSELLAYSNIHEKANSNFSTALSTVQLTDEDMQRQLHVQFENRWKALKDKLENIISERKEIEFNNLEGLQEETKKLLAQSIQQTEISLSMFTTNEDLLAYIQKLSFLKVSLERIYRKINAAGVPNKDFESVEQIGDLRMHVERCIDVTTKKMEFSVQNFEMSQAIMFRLEDEESEIENLKSKLINIQKESTNTGRTIKVKLLSIQVIKGRLDLQSRHLQMIEEDIKNIQHVDKEAAAIDTIARKLKSIEDSLSDLYKQTKETEIEAFEEGRLWEELEENMTNMRNIIGETAFKLQLSLARGHIDIKRLQTATKNIKDLESQHLSYDRTLKVLKESTNSVIAVASKQDGLELSTQLESIIISYNTVCADLLDIGTRYESSILLWERFIAMSVAVREWIGEATTATAEISASTAPVQDLIIQIKNLETAEKEQQDVIGQLKQLTTDICIQVGMDEGGRSHFVVEVDDLTHRIVTLRDTITGLHRTLNSRQNDINKSSNAVEETQNVLDGVKNALMIATPAEIIASLPPEDAVDQLTALRGQLLNLGKAESHISVLRPEVTSSCTALVPYSNTSDSIVSILQLWQTVFEDTLSRYHRMSAMLASQHAKDATLRVWESHLDQVAANLSAPPSASYTEIAEQMRMGSLHRSLLTQSQQLMLRSSPPVHGQVQRLTRRNQEVLDQLEQRASLLRSRHALWDNYNIDQERLSSWLRDMEREKQMLNLKHVAIKRISKVLKKIEYLLKKMPHGEKLLKDLIAQQTELQANYDSNTISSVRIELHSIQERISSLRAGLRTWRDHLQRIQRLATECENKEQKASEAMDEPKEILDTPIPQETGPAQRDLLLCKASTANLDCLTPELEALNLLQEELKECVSPSDIKQTSQRAWLLWQKQADLKHQLAIRMQQLESRSALLDLFRTQHERFMDWSNRMESRLEGRDAGVQDLIYRFENGYRGEIDSKEKDLSWLKKVEEQLCSASHQEQKEIEEATKSANSSYKNILNLYNIKLAKLKDILAAQMRLESELRELKVWLSDFENRINEPWRLKGIGLEEYKNNLKSHSDIEKKINQNSEKVSTVLNQGEILLNDFDNPSASTDTYHIQNDISNIEIRWKNICFKTSEIKRINLETWEQWQLYLEQYKTLNKWTEKRLSITKFEIATIKWSDCKEKQKELDKIMNDMNDDLNTLDEFNSLYCLLARQGKLDESGEIKKIHTSTNDDWEALTDRTINHIKMLAEKYDNFESFMALKEREMTWLRQLDAQLTEIEYSSSMDDEEKRRKLQEIKIILSQRTAKLDNVKKIAGGIILNYHEDDTNNVNKNIEALVLLHEDVEARLLRLLDDLCVEESKSQLHLTVHKARNLAKKGMFGKADPYVILKYGIEKYQSKTIKNSQNPEWQYETDFVITENTPKEISVEVYDEDHGKDDPMGVAAVSISEITDTIQINQKWIPMKKCKSGEILISARYLTESSSLPNQDIQDSSLKFEQDRSVQTDTLSLTIPDSGVFMSTSIVSPGVGTPDDLVPEIEKDEIDLVKPLPNLTDRSKEQLIVELDNTILDCKTHVENLELSLDITEDQDHLLNELTRCRASLGLCQHYSSVLKSRFGLSGSTIRETSIIELQKMILSLEEKVKDKGIESLGASSRTYSEVLKSGSVDDKSGSVSPGATCPLCRRRNWKQLEGDLWRLERWLEHAGGSLAQLLRQGVPGSIEQLEEVIQDHREFLLNLDSHKSVAMSINVVGCHLAEHTPTQTKAEAMRTRLAAVNEKWDHVCEQATLWQTRLQTALLENGEFHQTIQELLQWLETTTATIKEAEPVDLTVSKPVLQTKYNKFLELQKDLQRCEPRVVSLQEAADQLELQADSPACKQVKKKLAILSRSLRGLIQVCGIYLTNLARTLGLPPPPPVPDCSMYDSALNINATVLPPLTDQLMAVESPEQAIAVPTPRPVEQSDDEINTGVLSRSYRFLGRVVRAAVPIQALMLLLLGVSSIVPLDQDELICSLQNNLQRSLEPMLQWSNGPPPI